MIENPTECAEYLSYHLNPILISVMISVIFYKFSLKDTQMKMKFLNIAKLYNQLGEKILNLTEDLVIVNNLLLKTYYPSPKALIDILF